jgi:hypothetical protein
MHACATPFFRKASLLSASTQADTAQDTMKYNSYSLYSLYSIIEVDYLNGNLYLKQSHCYFLLGI